MMNKQRHPWWARTLSALPGLIVLYVVLGALDTRLSPARRGPMRPCPMEGRGDVFYMRPVGPDEIFHPTALHPPVIDVFGERVERCLVQWETFGLLSACFRDSPVSITSTWIVHEGVVCVEAEANGFIAHGPLGEYVRTDLQLLRTDTMSWFERLAMRGGDEPLKAAVLIVVLIGALILPWTWTWRWWSTLHVMVAIWGFWVVGPFASLL